MKNNIKVIICFILLTLIITFPALLHLGDKIIGDLGDAYQFLGFQHIAKTMFFAGQFPFGWTDFWRYPHGVNFQNIYDSSAFIIVGLFLYKFFSNPILVYNLSVLIFVFLNLLLSFILFKQFFRPLVALAGAIIYGLSFYSIARLGGHMNLFFTASFAFLLFGLVSIYKQRGDKKSFIWLGLGLILVPFASLQYGLIFIGSLIFLIPLFNIFFEKELKEFIDILSKRKIYVLITGVCVYILFSLFHGDKLILLLKGEVQMPIYEITSIPIINYFIPNSYLHAVGGLIANSSREWIENVVFLGFIEMVIFVFAVIRLKASKTKSFLLACFGLFLILALGKQEFLPWIWPYQYIFPFLPFRGIIEPNRFFVIFYLAFTFVILHYLSRIANKKILIFIIFLLIIERLPLNFRLSPNQYNHTLITNVNKRPTKAVLDLPLYIDWWNGQIYDAYSVYYEKPIVNGYIHWSGESPQSQDLTSKIEKYRCFYDSVRAPADFNQYEAILIKEQLIYIMRKHDIRTVVIHKDLYFNTDHCTRARNYINVFLENKNQWEKIYEDQSLQILWLK